MLRRKINEKLISWKNNPDKLPLVVEGARQVGKTTSILEFAKTSYKTVIELNFYRNPGLRRIFDGDLDADTILSRLSLYSKNWKIIDGSTLIFLDEIQHCPNARTALKFLAHNPRFDVIASGSLLGLNFSEISSFPVGQTETLTMNPLDFEEYLWAMGIDERVIDKLKEHLTDLTPVDDFLHQSMLSYFISYMIIGGMPAVVAKFSEDRDYAKAQRKQRSIINDYKKDVIRYADDTEKVKIIRCFDSIPSQLAKDYKKFQYSVVEKGSTSSKYGGALLWLNDASIVSFCHNLSKIDNPLEGFSIPNEFKVYVNDTGLLVSMYANDTARRLMDGDLGIFKGAFYENIMANCLLYNGYKLYYFAPHSNLEIDFVIIFKGKPCLIEIKSGENTKSKSLRTVLNDKKYGINQAIRFSRKNIADTGDILCLPLYMAPFLSDTEKNDWQNKLTPPEDLLQRMVEG